MSATGTPTPNLGLRIPLGTDPAAVEDINYNAGVLDTKIGAIGNNTVKGLLDHASDEIGSLGDGLAIIANGNTHAAIAAGEFVFVRNHSTLATGLYKATSSIAANAALSSSNLTADSKGGLNSLSDQITNIVTLLWSNSNRSQAFSGQAIQVDTTGYSYLVITFGGTDTYSMDTIFIEPNNSYGKATVNAVYWAGGQINEIQRDVSWTDNNTITFANAVKNGVQDNTVVIPYRIYGIKL